MLQGLITATSDRKIKLRIVNNIATEPSEDIVKLSGAGIASDMLFVLGLASEMV